MNLVSITLKKFREEHSLSFAATGSRLGISGAQVHQLEKGEDLPSVRTLRSIAKFFGWSEEQVGRYVLSFEGPAPGPKPKRQRKKQ